MIFNEETKEQLDNFKSIVLDGKRCYFIDKIVILSFQDMELYFKKKDGKKEMNLINRSGKDDGRIH